MIVNNIVLFILVVLFHLCFTEVIQDTKSKMDALDETEIEEFLQHDIKKFIEKFEEAALKIQNHDEDVPLLESSTDIYNELTSIVQDIFDLNVNPNNVIKFLQAKGLDRVVAPNLKISYTLLRRQLLLLVKQSFDIAPSSVKSVIPVSILDSVLEIFEKDDSLPVKAYALDVLKLWLPGNPKMQARVMKLKGLEPFYHQIAKLDVVVIQTLLDLFNEIIEEHITARNKGSRLYSAEDLTLYQRIGLLERLSTSYVCNGLLSIFETSLPVIHTRGGYLPSMFELVKKIEPFCLKIYKRKSKPLKVFNELLEYINDLDSERDLLQRGVNVIDIRNVLEKYVNELKHTVVKEEL